MGLDSLGVKVTEVRKTRAGAVAMTVGKGEEGAGAAEKLRVAVEAVLNADAGVRIHSNTLYLHTLGISGDDASPLITSRDLHEKMFPRPKSALGG